MYLLLFFFLLFGQQNKHNFVAKFNVMCRFCRLNIHVECNISKAYIYFLYTYIKYTSTTLYKRNSNNNHIVQNTILLTLLYRVYRTFFFFFHKVSTWNPIILYTKLYTIHHHVAWLFSFFYYNNQISIAISEPQRFILYIILYNNT